MKTKVLALLFAMLMLVPLVSCKAEEEKPKYVTEEHDEFFTIPAEGAWKNATYRENMTFGEGKKTITLRVVADNTYVTFTIHTDKETLAEALLENQIVEGEDGPYGLYIKKVNGIEADYDKDQHYWSFEIQGQAQVHGVSEAKISGGETFELVYAK